jgi:hypothetical protein
VCYQNTAGGNITSFNSPASDEGVETAIPINSTAPRIQLSASGSIKLPAGSYKIGMCIKNKSGTGAALNNSNYVNGFIEIKLKNEKFFGYLLPNSILRSQILSPAGICSMGRSLTNGNLMIETTLAVWRSTITTPTFVYPGFYQPEVLPPRCPINDVIMVGVIWRPMGSTRLF